MLQRAWCIMVGSKVFKYNDIMTKEKELIQRKCVSDKMINWRLIVGCLVSLWFLFFLHMIFDN